MAHYFHVSSNRFTFTTLAMLLLASISHLLIYDHFLDFCFRQNATCGEHSKGHALLSDECLLSHSNYHFLASVVAVQKESTDGNTTVDVGGGEGEATVKEKTKTELTEASTAQTTAINGTTTKDSAHDDASIEVCLHCLNFFCLLMIIPNVSTGICQNSHCNVFF
jgi:hypothetical protein